MMEARLAVSPLPLPLRSPPSPAFAHTEPSRRRNSTRAAVSRATYVHGRWGGREGDMIAGGGPSWRRSHRRPLSQCPLAQGGGVCGACAGGGHRRRSGSRRRPPPRCSRRPPRTPPDGVAVIFYYYYYYNYYYCSPLVLFVVHLAAQVHFVVDKSTNKDTE